MSNAVAPRLLEARTEDPDIVWNWYQFQRQILGEERARVSAIMNNSQSVSATLSERYLGLTENELESLFARQLSELDLLAILGMLAATEGYLQSDFRGRTDLRLKDSVSQEFLKAKKRRKRTNSRVDLDQDILDVWSKFGPIPRAKNAVSAFRSALNLRHWLAHGRYWVEKLGRDFDTQDVHVICVGLLQSLEI